MSRIRDYDGNWHETANLSGVQQVRLLGPYRVDWDNSDVVDPSAYFPVFDEIAAGSLVEPFVVVAEVFDGGATAEIGVDVVDGGPFTTLLTAIYDLTQATDNPAAFSEAHWPGASLTLLEANSPHKAIARAPCRIKLAIWTGGGETITQGAIDIYALIAEPA